MRLSGRIIVFLGSAAVSLFVAAVALAQDRPGVGATAGQAHVVVYRTGRHRDPTMIKPSVYCDDKDVALMYAKRFFTINLAPGKHRISSSDEHTVVSLDAESGVTYYVRLSVVRGLWINNTFKVEQVDASTAQKELAPLKPAETKHVNAPEIVSIEAILKR
jgi:hypothetical protein